MSAARFRFLVGLGVAGAYASVALWVSGPPVRPMFDIGGPPAPYRWVNPPPEFAATNQKPGAASHEVPLTSAGSDAASVATSDNQAALILREGTFRPRSGEKAVVVRIDPLDAATIGTTPPGLRYDGNAYRIIAAYKKSGVEAKPTQPPTVVLQFPLVATKLFRRDGNVWTDLKASPVSVSLQIFSTTSQLGVFVAAGPPLDTSQPPSKGKFPAALVISLSAALAAVVAGLFARFRARKRRAGSAATSAKRGASPRRRPPKR